MSAAKEVPNCELDAVRVQEVRWNRDGKEPASEYTFVCGKG
jgi:hypothetical protein